MNTDYSQILVDMLLDAHGAWMSAETAARILDNRKKTLSFMNNEVCIRAGLTKIIGLYTGLSEQDMRDIVARDEARSRKPARAK